jgi:hypothetical protein
MSKEVLSVFGLMNEKSESSNEKLSNEQMLMALMLRLQKLKAD